MAEPCEHGFANRDNCQWCAQHFDDKAAWWAWMMVIGIIVGASLLWWFIFTHSP